MSMTNGAQAQSISSLADTQAEYQAYVYTYMAKATLHHLPNAVQKDIDNASSYSERQKFELERLLATGARSDANRAFQHAIDALKTDDAASWNECRLDLLDAIDACEQLLDYQLMIGSTSSRRATVQTTLAYLDIAVENAGRAYRTIRVPTGRG
ncbi:hypothetical protein [Planctomycetes bacterium K23_9]